MSKDRSAWLAWPIIVGIVILVALGAGLVLRSCAKADAVGPLELQELRQTAGVTQPAVSFPTRTPRTTYLPNTQAVNDWIDAANNAGPWKWYRSDIEFKLGFEQYLKSCVTMPADTMVDYLLRFRRDADSDEFIGTIEMDMLNANLRERQVTEEQWEKFRGCAEEYLRDHTWSAADYQNDTSTWGSGTLFPIGSGPFYARLKAIGVEVP